MYRNKILTFLSQYLNICILLTDILWLQYHSHHVTGIVFTRGYPKGVSDEKSEDAILSFYVGCTSDRLEKGVLFLLWDMYLYKIRDFNTTRIFILHILYCFRK